MNDGIAGTEFHVVIAFSTRENAEKAVRQIDYAMEKVGLLPFVVRIEEVVVDAE